MFRSRSLTYASVVLTTFFWGSNFNVSAHVVRYLPPISSAVERFAIACTLLPVWLGLRGQLHLQVLRRNAAALASIGVLGVTGFNVAGFFALRSTSPINAALIMATTPLWTMACSVLLERERLDRGRILGLACGIAGVVLVISRGDAATLLELRFARGDVYMLGGALAWSLATVLSRRLVRGVGAQETTGWSMLFGSLALLALGLVFEHPLQAIAAAPASVHLGVAYLAIGGSLLAYLFWFGAVRALGAPRTAAFFNLVPVFTLLVSLATGLIPNAWQLMGVASVVLGVVLASRSPPAASPAEPRVGQAEPCTDAPA